MKFKCPRAKRLQTFDWLYEFRSIKNILPSHRIVIIIDDIIRVNLKKNRIHKYQPDTNIYNSALKSLLDKQ